MPDLLTPPLPTTPAKAPAPPTKTKEEKPSKFFSEYYPAAILFLITAFIGAAFLFLRPIITDIKDANAQTQSTLTDAQNERDYLKSLEESIDAAHSISGTVLDDVNQALPNDADIPAFMVQIGSAAFADGIRIGSLSFAEAKAVAPTVTGAAQSALPIDVNLVIRAHDYFDVKRFLATLESSLRVIDVVGIAAGGGDGDVTYNLQLRMYRFNAPQKAVIPQP